jgi:hypothetical protein
MYDNSSYKTSSPFIKILAWLTALAFVFTLFHLAMLQLDYIPNPVLGEIGTDLQHGIPFFFFLTGTSITNKTLRIPWLIFFPVFFISYVTLTVLSLDGIYDWEFFNITRANYQIVKWIVGISLAGLCLTYLVHFLMRNARGISNFSQLPKTILDILKLGWLLCLSYAFLSIQFPIGFHGLFFLFLSTWFYVLLMFVGLFLYFRKPS